MPKLPPPPGTVTREVAVRVLVRERIITSSPMLTKLKGIDRIVPEGRSHGYYKENQLLKIINDRRELHGQPSLAELFYEDHSIEFRQATPEDMPGVYNVAVKLFGTTTPANDRIPLLKGC